MEDQEEIGRYRELREIVRRLRAPDGCPWDREQTHTSLRPYLLQEAYEVIATLDDGDTARLPDELGDLLWQVLIHAQVAEEAGEFSMSDVLGTIAAKLVRRHPHVFGDERLATAAEVVERWETLKRNEREEEASALQGVPVALPALAQAQEVLRRAAAAGFAWPGRDDVVAKIAEEVEELAAAETVEARTEEFGDLLLNLANYARYLNVDAEDALRLAVAKFRRRFLAAEALARESGRSFAAMSREELLGVWDEVKRQG